MRERIFYVSEKFPKQFIGGSKARDDIDTILKKLEFIEIPVKSCRVFNKKTDGIKNYINLKKNWKTIKKRTSEDDIIIIQYPFGNYSVNIKNMRTLNKRNKFIAIIHDIPSVQENAVSKQKEYELLKSFDVIICHNDKMKEYLTKNGIDRDKLVSLEIFDYLFENKSQKPFCDKNQGITVAGNIHPNKAAYIYKLIDKKENININLYGPNFDNRYKGKVNYLGCLPPDELVNKIVGSYGLIWDGDSLDNCTGTYGEYQRINNPHRTSMYLAAGMPIIIWKEAALKDFIEKNGVGIVVNGLKDLSFVLNSITQEEYDKMVAKTQNISIKLREGYYISKAINKAIDLLNVKEL